ncbi:hypothetical protein [uncultured Ilyobacter sp.]|uniref:hypothetical protein n=1 Tax=uncultured Ilyobacter sp. TaxID=544433 RepID=UPI0029C06866|nr:hypothetical protein [uncultured Ilyobacter sp.]
MTVNYSNKGIEVWNKQKERYKEVIKKHRTENKIRNYLKDYKKGETTQLDYKNFPPEKIILEELDELRLEEIIEYVLTVNSIKIRILKEIKKTREFSKELKYLRGMVYRKNHYYIMSDSKGKSYRVPSKKMLGFQLDNLFLIQGKATGRKIISIKNVEIIKK